jgi:hypothetical protein
VEHAVHKVKEFEIVGQYQLRVEFADGLFNAVEIDADAHTLVWPNGADFDPAILHDWPDHEAAMVALARQWAAAAAAKRADRIYSQ